MTRLPAAAGLAMLLATAAYAGASGYDPSSEISVNGVIRYVISTEGSDGTVGVHLELTTPEGPVRVHVAPAMFIGMNNFSFLAGDSVTVRGSRVVKDGLPAIWAKLIVKEGRTLVLRDEDGTPRWPRATLDDPDGCGVSHAPVR